MEILKSTVTDNAKRYVMMRGPQVKKLSDFVDKEVKLVNYILYTNETVNPDDENAEAVASKVLTLEFDNGSMAATNSPTFIKEFEVLLAAFDDKLDGIPSITIIKQKSNKGREFINFKLEL